MTQRVITHYRCNRCGSEFSHGEGAGRFAYSSGSFAYSEKGYDGGWGGYKKNYDLCGNCTTELKNFFSFRPKK